MQRSLIIAAALASIASGAFAQSLGNVTLYGRVNVTIERQKFGNVSNTVMQNNASRFGLKGSEDLGGGLKAGFQLEHRFNINNGAATYAAFWGGAGVSEVNLSGGFGMVRLGHFTSEAYYATADYVSLHNHDTGTSSDALYTYLGRDDSKVSYRSPSFGGATLEIGTTVSSPTQDDTLDLALNYDAGPLHLGLGYQKDGDANQFALRGLYEMGAITFGGYYQRSDLPVIGTRDTFRLSGMYAMGATELHANIGRAGDFSNVANSAATQYTLGVNQNLSKRTKVYGFYTKISTDIAGADFSSFAVGVRHNF
ncbi:MAG: porin [Burkholderiaceae bacterium]|nr:porin [Burkholderiaceae bacterium]